MDYRQQAVDELRRCQGIALARYGFDTTVTMEWEIRGLVAGHADYHTMHIGLNEAIARAEGEAFRRTVAHELAHLVTYWRWYRATAEAKLAGCARGSRRPAPHGLEWQSVFRAFGYAPSRCHNYASATRAVERRVYEYKCACGLPHPVSIVRHRKMLRGVSYRCTRCKTRLTAV